MTLRPGQVIDLDKPVSPDASALIYTWADHINRSVIIRNRSLAKIKTLQSTAVSTGIPIFVHRQRPCLYATIAGIVVGLTAKDRKWEYMIDDGTQVIDVTVHAQSVPASIAPQSNRTASTSSYTLNMPEPDLRLADVVKVTGKIWRRQWGKGAAKVGLDVVDLQLLNLDPTAEARHNLMAHELEQGEYAQPFGVLGGSRTLPSADLPSKSLHSQWSLNGFIGDTGIPYAEMVGAYERLAVGPLSGKSTFQAPAERRLPSTTTTTTKRPREPSNNTEDSTRPATSSRSTTRAQTRSLRAPSRLTDSECTQSLFRLHVQKFITDHCGDNTTTEAPAFSISFLQRVKSLAELSDRIVSIMLRKRAARGARAQVSTEPKGDKIRRLFEWCIRELLKDGFVVIASQREVDVGLLRSRRLSRLMHPEGSAKVYEDQEAYQLVTPRLLREPLRRILRGRGDSSPATLLRHLQKSDERWKFANVESVEEALIALRNGGLAA